MEMVEGKRDLPACSVGLRATLDIRIASGSESSPWDYGSAFGELQGGNGVGPADVGWAQTEGSAARRAIAQRL